MGYFHALLACSAAIFLVLALWRSVRIQKTSSSTPPGSCKYVKFEEKEESYPDIEPLPEFRWEDTLPLTLRPFKPKYNLTMAISKSHASELIEIDKNYLERVSLRKRLLIKERETCVAALDNSKSAVDEFYTWMIGTYLPTRYPLMFKVFDDSKLLNTATGELIPLHPPSTPSSALEILGTTIEDDLNFLLPAKDGDGYSLHATISCFVNGFSMAKLLDVKLRDIHKPVPSYKEKLELSMDRFFDRLDAGTFVKRENWAMNLSPDLFATSGNHNYEGQDNDESLQDVDPTKTYLRCERQVLHRLPKTKAIVLSTKTYQYSLSDIKAEGSGPELAEAIDGLRRGNAPGIHFYKRATVWSESIKRFLKD